MQVLITSGVLPRKIETDLRIDADKIVLVAHKNQEELAWLDVREVPASIMPKNYHAYLYHQTVNNWLGAV